LAARELAEKHWRISGDEPFLAGLVQDIGLLALVQHLGEPYLTLLVLVEHEQGDLLERELQMLGFDHAVLSARLLAHWGLPAGLCASISVPPCEARIAELSPSERTLPQILHLAELLARLLERPDGPALEQLTEIGGRYCSLTSAELTPIVQTLEQKVTALAGVLALELEGGPTYVELLVAAQQRLADETLDVAARLAAVAPETELLALTTRLQGELAVACGRNLAPPATAANGPSLAERDVPQADASRPGNDGGPAGSYAAGNHTAAATAPRVKTAPPASTFVADASLLSRVSAAVQRCRQLRRPLSLALFEIDRFSDVLVELGPAGMAEVTHWLCVALADWTGQRAGATLVSDSCLAIVWEDCPRNEAVQMARQVLAAVRPWSSAEFVLRTDLTLSCGLATVEFAPKNFLPQALLDASQRCLGGAQLSGGDTVKSIAF
jgi:GGDEF domain-containing protein